jgi:hypothetical protein
VNKNKIAEISQYYSDLQKTKKALLWIPRVYLKIFLNKLLTTKFSPLYYLYK